MKTTKDESALLAYCENLSILFNGLTSGLRSRSYSYYYYPTFYLYHQVLLCSALCFVVFFFALFLFENCIVRTNIFFSPLLLLHEGSMSMGRKPYLLLLPPFCSDL